MQDLFLRFFVFAQTMPERTRDERGQTSVEWLAIGAALVVVIAALATFAHPIANAISDAIQKIIKKIG